MYANRYADGYTHVVENNYINILLFSGDKFRYCKEHNYLNFLSNITFFTIKPIKTKRNEINVLAVGIQNQGEF